MKQSKVFEYYKPLRNILRDFELFESLEVCWSIANHLQFSKALPEGFQLERKVKFSQDMTMFRIWVISDWELEFLINEIILNSPQRVFGKSKSLKDIKYRDRVVSYIRKLDDTAIKEVLSDDNLFTELNRMSHRQFPWQGYSYIPSLYRYFLIFNFPGMGELVVKQTGMTPFEVIHTGLAFMAHFYKDFSIPNPSTIDIEFIDKTITDKFINLFSLDIDNLKNKLTNKRIYDDKIFYDFNPLRMHPMIKVDSMLTCPMPTLLNWEVTSGIYYLINQETAFSNYYGNAFQTYMYLITERTLTETKFVIHKEEKYGSPEKGTADLIIEDNDALLFIECKTKRMVLEAQNNIISLTLEKDIGIIADGITQLYKTIKEYQDNQYPNLRFNPNKLIYIMIVTLEEWYLGFNPHWYEILKEKVKVKLNLGDLDGKIIDVLPYQFRSADEYEYDIHIMSILGIKEYFEKFANEGGRDAFKDLPYKYILMNDYKDTFVNIHKK